MTNNRKKITFQNSVSNYMGNHRVSLGLFLASYGVFYMSSVLLSRWTIADWGKDITSYPPSTINTIVTPQFYRSNLFCHKSPSINHRSYNAYALTVIHGITPEAPVDKQYVAILLTCFWVYVPGNRGLAIGEIDDFPWQWQKQIILNGSIFAWILYLLSLVVLFVGVVSLYKHSVIYH